MIIPLNPDEARKLTGAGYKKKIETIRNEVFKRIEEAANNGEYSCKIVNNTYETDLVLQELKDMGYSVEETKEELFMATIGWW